MKPKVGDSIYIGTLWYIDRGEDDVASGKATINAIKIIKMSKTAGKLVYFVEVKEIPGRYFNYEILLERQEELRREFGEQKAHPDPDYG